VLVKPTKNGKRSTWKYVDDLKGFLMGGGENQPVDNSGRGRRIPQLSLYVAKFLSNREIHF